MRFEVLSLGSNVIRFPIELRAKPSLDLLINIAPDSREIALVAEAFGLPEPDPEGRDKADRAMAETIARTALPPDPVARRAALDALLKPFVERAVAVCAEFPPGGTPLRRRRRKGRQRANRRRLLAGAIGGHRQLSRDRGRRTADCRSCRIPGRAGRKQGRRLRQPW